jgi:hypothetical protein
MVAEVTRERDSAQRLSSHAMSARCRQLNTKESDAMFFPGSGGKPSKAKSFCAQCPVADLCLKEAIEENYDGFFAGTTREERVIMARYFHITPKTVDEAMPPEPERKRKVYLKVASNFEDTLTYLNSIVSPFDSGQLA